MRAPILKMGKRRPGLINMKLSGVSLVVEMGKEGTLPKRTELNLLYLNYRAYSPGAAPAWAPRPGTSLGPGLGGPCSVPGWDPPQERGCRDS